MRKQKPKRDEFNTLYDEKDDDTFKSFREQKRYIRFGRQKTSVSEAVKNLVGNISGTHI